MLIFFASPTLPQEGPREGDLPPAPPRPSISILDVSPGQQLWGHVERATNFGAYVDVGTEVPGFLHLKEIPGRPKVRTRIACVCVCVRMCFCLRIFFW